LPRCPRIFGGRSKEVELIEARLNPKADVPSTIRKMVAPAAAPPSLPLTVATPPEVEDAPALPTVVLPPAPSPAPNRLQFTNSKETHDTLRRVQNLLCREIPDGDPAVIFDRALQLLVRDVEKKKLGATARPRAPRACTIDGLHIPAHVRRAVWKRDGGRCAFVGKSGRCTETRYIEWHHVQPRGHHGPATIDNISLRCRAHNVYESDLVFGPFDPSVARESRAIYVVSREISPFRNGGGGGGKGRAQARATT
jgi:hypothetical protein